MAAQGGRQIQAALDVARDQGGKGTGASRATIDAGTNLSDTLISGNVQRRLDLAAALICGGLCRKAERGGREGRLERGRGPPCATLRPVPHLLALHSWWAATTGTACPMGALGVLRTIV